MTLSTVETVEQSVVSMIGASMSGAAPAPSVVVTENEPTVEPFEFDAELQSIIAALTCRDIEFVRGVQHLIKPEYFENVGEATLVNICLKYYRQYNALPTATIIASLIREAGEKKLLRKEDMLAAVRELKPLLATDISQRKYAEAKVVEFVQHQAVTQAVLKSVDLISKRKFPEILDAIKLAIGVGKNEDGDAYNYFEKIEERSSERLDALAGKKVVRGITTGNPKLDDKLYHKGWGRRELTSIMGGAKTGKTTALINFAKSASLAGHNVLYVTLEVGVKIISERLDASLTDTLMSELPTKVHSIREKVEEAAKKAGKLIIHEYPSGTLTPDGLRRLIGRYKNPTIGPDGSIRPALRFDLIVVDYADIMAPNNRTQDVIENSKSIYVDLRAIAFEEDAAVLTATQTNREGHKSVVAKAEHVSEDFNKVRTVDLMISINKTEEEARSNIARLYFAASRNQAGGFTLVVKQNISMMKFIEAVIREE